MFFCRYYFNNLLKQSGRRSNRSLIRVQKWMQTTTTHYCKDDKGSKKELPGSVASKYEVFIDEKSPIIFDIEQEREKFYEVDNESDQLDKKRKGFYGISPFRGESGVINVDELVTILRRETALDIVVIKVPNEIAYVDYFVIATGRSFKHMTAIANYIRQVYKYKTNSEPGIPLVEGKESKDWKALDLGNIALHIMSKSARECYDLESLWSVGREYDSKSNMDDNTKDNYASILSKLMSSSNIS